MRACARLLRFSVGPSDLHLRTMQRPGTTHASGPVAQPKTCGTLACVPWAAERASPAPTESRLTTRDVGDPSSPRGKCPQNQRPRYGPLGGFLAMVRC